MERQPKCNPRASQDEFLANDRTQPTCRATTALNWGKGPGDTALGPTSALADLR